MYRELFSDSIPFAQAINENKRLWVGYAMRREEESTTRVVMKLMLKGNIPRSRLILRWLDNIDSHLTGNITSLKEVFERKCFENRQDRLID